MKPLEGVKVVDLTTYLAAPTTVRVLGEWGADCIKIESHKGDPARTQGAVFNMPFTDDENLAFDVANLNKKFITLNLKTEKGLEICYKLLEEADVFVTNTRTKSLDVNRTRIVISLVAVLLASISTAVAGAVSFLGLIVPHIGRILVGSDHKLLIPFSALAGAFTFLAADTLGRTIAAPNEISAAVIMSVVGGPFFILLLRRSKRYGD